jgi:hypothetical protein
VKVATRLDALFFADLLFDNPLQSVDGVDGNGYRLEQRHPVAQQRSHRARKLRHLELENNSARQRYF